jgi:peptide/nickel transport system substrate-binding protein
MGELDNARRGELLRQGTRMAMEDIAIIPLHNQVNIWAMRRGLQHEARVDEYTRPQDVRPAAR